MMVNTSRCVYIIRIAIGEYICIYNIIIIHAYSATGDFTNSTLYKRRRTNYIGIVYNMYAGLT